MKKKTEYVEGNEALENFERALEHVVKVSHREIKAKLDAEKGNKLPRSSAKGKK